MAVEFVEGFVLSIAHMAAEFKTLPAQLRRRMAWREQRVARKAREITIIAALLIRLMGFADKKKDPSRSRESLTFPILSLSSYTTHVKKNILTFRTSAPHRLNQAEHRQEVAHYR